MATGKNKKMGKKGASKKKAVDPFTRKIWYDIKAPIMFDNRSVGKTLVNRSQGTRLAADSLKGRIYEVSLSDLMPKSDADYRKLKLICEDIQGLECLTNFHGMSFTRDKTGSIVRKWHTLIEANVAVKTTDGYVLRLFCIGFTKRHSQQVKKTTYAKSSAVKLIRAKMVEIIQKEVSSTDLKGVVTKLIPDSIGKDVEKAAARIYPLQDVYIRKVKILKKPKFELARLLEIHNDDGPALVEGPNGEMTLRAEDYEPPVMQSV